MQPVSRFQARRNRKPPHYMYELVHHAHAPRQPWERPSPSRTTMREEEKDSKATLERAVRRTLALRRHHHMQQQPITCRRRRLLLEAAAIDRIRRRSRRRAVGRIPASSRTTAVAKAAAAAAAAMRGNLRRSPSAGLSLGRRVPARPVWSGGCEERIPLPAKRMRLQQLRNHNDDKDGRGNAK